jgi:hypothetical protein
VPTTQSLSNRSPARSNGPLCNRALESQHFGSCRRTIEASIPVDGDIGDHAFVEHDFLVLAWHLGILCDQMSLNWRTTLLERSGNWPRKER